MLNQFQEIKSIFYSTEIVFFIHWANTFKSSSKSAVGNIEVVFLPEDNAHDDY